MLQCVAVCCSVLQCVAVAIVSCFLFIVIYIMWHDTFKCVQFDTVCCSVLQRVAAACLVLHTLQSFILSDITFKCVAACCSVLQCVAVYCSVLQFAALCCSVL